MKARSLFPLFAACLSVCLSSQAALADSVSLTLNSPSSVSPQTGGTLDYIGTIAAASTNTGDEYINGDAYSIGAPFTVNDSGFYSNFPGFLTPGQTVTGLFFDIVVPADSAIGTYTGSFTLLGGSTAIAADSLATASFSAAVTPEPSTWLLLGTGVLGAGVLLRRRNTSATAIS